MRTDVFLQCAYRRETAYENSKKLLQQRSAEWAKQSGRHLLTVTKRIEQKQQGETVKPQRTGIERIEKDK